MGGEGLDRQELCGPRARLQIQPHLPKSHQPALRVGANILFQSLEVVGIRRLVVQIRPISKNDLLPELQRPGRGSRCSPTSRPAREFYIDNLLVRIHSIIVMTRWTGLAPWVFEFPFPGSLPSHLPGRQELCGPWARLQVQPHLPNRVSF